MSIGGGVGMQIGHGYCSSKLVLKMWAWPSEKAILDGFFLTSNNDKYA